MEVNLKLSRLLGYLLKLTRVADSTRGNDNRHGDYGSGQNPSIRRVIIPGFQRIGENISHTRANWFCN